MSHDNQRPDIKVALLISAIQASAESGQLKAGHHRQKPITAAKLAELSLVRYIVDACLPAMQRQDELMLSEAFHEGTRQVRKALGPGTPLQIINFDWHGMIRDLKEKETVRCLWEHLKVLLPRSDLSAGTMEPSPTSAPADASQRSVLCRSAHS